MKEKQKNTQRGITLVALVITIIVLLILAMVSIKIALDGGLIEKTKDAVGIHNEKEAEQKSTLDTMTSMIYAAKKEVEKPTKEEEKKFKPYKDVDATEDETADVTKIIAGYGMEDLSNFPSDALGIVYGRTNGNMLLEIHDKKNNKIYVYTDSDETAKPLNIKSKKWYVGGSGPDSMKPIEEYKGPSPIQVSDFPSNCIYSVSYLEKIIRSFGTEPDTNELYKLSKLTPEELKQCDTQKIKESYLIAAHNFNSSDPVKSDFIVMAIQYENDFGVAILDGKNQKTYVYHDTKNFFGPGMVKEKYNRWALKDNSEEITYTGKSPINLSDFTEGEIYCKSYLEKIIKSFE